MNEIRCTECGDWQPEKDIPDCTIARTVELSEYDDDGLAYDLGQICRTCRHCFDVIDAEIR